VFIRRRQKRDGKPPLNTTHLVCGRLISSKRTIFQPILSPGQQRGREKWRIWKRDLSIEDCLPAYWTIFTTVSALRHIAWLFILQIPKSEPCCCNCANHFLLRFIESILKPWRKPFQGSWKWANVWEEAGEKSETCRWDLRAYSWRNILKLQSEDPRDPISLEKPTHRIDPRKTFSHSLAKSMNEEEWERKRW